MSFIEKTYNKEKWAIILGGTGSFGLATAKQLVKDNFNLVLVYRERKTSLSQLEDDLLNLRNCTKTIEYNLNANLTDNKETIIKSLIEDNKLKGKISFVLHAIADGNLNSMFNSESQNSLKYEDFLHTIETMGLSLYDWTKRLFENGLLSNKTSIVGLTSEGTHRFFEDYAAVASAKAVMESNIKYIAVEMCKYGVRANLINAGITDTKALRSFPKYAEFIDKAKQRNPCGRLTTAEDVAKVIAFLAKEESEWINGTVLTVDGGEQLISFY
jgi:enoyl-[acyl-carrier protein] reductase I